jgi:hypothetical protein
MLEAGSYFILSSDLRILCQDNEKIYLGNVLDYQEAISFLVPDAAEDCLTSARKRWSYVNFTLVKWDELNANIRDE